MRWCRHAPLSTPTRQSFTRWFIAAPRPLRLQGWFVLQSRKANSWQRNGWAIHFVHEVYCFVSPIWPSKNVNNQSHETSFTKAQTVHGLYLKISVPKPIGNENLAVKRPRLRARPKNKGIARTYPNIAVDSMVPTALWRVLCRETLDGKKIVKTCAYGVLYNRTFLDNSSHI